MVGSNNRLQFSGREMYEVGTNKLSVNLLTSHVHLISNYQFSSLSMGFAEFG